MAPRLVIPEATAVIEPTPSQLDLTDFDIMYTQDGALKVDPPPPRMEIPTASGAKGAFKPIKRKAFSARLFKSTFRLFTFLKGL
jgi:hypothetical protein